MITGKRVTVGSESVDLADGTGLSGSKILSLTNLGSTSVWIGDVGEGFEISPGDKLSDLELGSVDGIALVRDKDAEPEPVQFLLSYSPAG